MTEQIGGLSVDLVADVSAYQQAMRQATKSLQDSTNSWSGSIANAQRSIQGMFAPILGLKTVLLGLGAGGFTVAVKSALGMAGAIQDLSDRTNLSTDAIQEYRFAFSQVGVAEGEATSALEGFTRRVGEAKNGTGELVSGLRDSNRAFLETIRMAPSMDAALEAAFTELARIPDAAQRAALAQDLFGKQGVKLTAVVKDGSEGLAAMREQARAFGLVLDKDLIAGADEAGDRLAALAQTLDTQFKRALLGLTPLLIGATTALAELSVAASRRLFPDNARELAEFEAGLTRLTARLADLTQRRAEAEQRGAAGGFFDKAASALAVRGIDKEISAIQEEIALVVPLVAVGREMADQKAREAAARKANTQEIGHTVKALKDEAASMSIAGADLKAFGQERQAALALVSALGGAEQSEVDQLNDLGDAYAKGAVTAAEFERTLDAVQRKNRDVATSAQDAADVMRQLGLTFGDAFADAIVDGKRLDEVLRALEKDLLRLAIRGAVTQGIASLFTPGGAPAGGVLPGGTGNTATPYAMGGPVSGGQLTMVGERGPELFIPRMSGEIVPNHQLGGATLNFDFRGADASVIPRVEAMIRAAAPQIVAQAVNTFSDARKRGQRI